MGILRHVVLMALLDCTNVLMWITEKPITDRKGKRRIDQYIEVYYSFVHSKLMKN